MGKCRRIEGAGEAPGVAQAHRMPAVGDQGSFSPEMTTLPAAGITTGWMPRSMASF
jgi:hypothetical protein